MEIWSAVSAFLTHRVEQLGVSASSIPVGLLIAAILFPILLAALARQPIAFFSTALLIAGLLAIDPASVSAGVLVAMQSYIAAVLIGCMAVLAWYRDRSLKAQLARMRAEIERLSVAEERRVETEMRAETEYQPVHPVAPVYPAPFTPQVQEPAPTPPLQAGLPEHEKPPEAAHATIVSPPKQEDRFAARPEDRPSA
jgi:hypothetical protein